MSNTNDIPFEVYQWVSGQYLTRQLPDNWNDMSEDDQDVFLAEHACGFYEYWDARDLWKEIDRRAYDAYNFFKGVK